MTDKNESTPHARPLWAPWRIEYIRSAKPDGCFFCEKGTRTEDVADHIIARGETAFVLMNDFPYNSGHVLVAPYRHVSDLSLLETVERNEIMELLVKAEEVLRKVMAPSGFNIGFNLGESAGAGVADHVHGHVVPRWIGDTNFMPVLADRRVVPEALEETANLLREAWNA
ncbi:MAG: HIT domain-containing protein [Lentisphaeria bacterium]|nr:HIT domain-containing protein [Lentisphaeria bacterium]